MIRIRSRNFWPGFDLKAFLTTIIGPLDGRVEVVASGPCDIEVCSTFGDEPPTPGVFRVFWTMESIWSVSGLPLDDFDWLFSYFHEDDVGCDRYCRINVVPPMMVGERRVDLESVMPVKTRFCNYVYRHEVAYRDKFFRMLDARMRVDSPGLCMNNMPPIGGHSDPLTSRKSMDWARQKQSFLSPYRFTIAFENHVVPGYVTEKIVQAFASPSVPIYYGSPRIIEDFNPAAFVNAHNFDSFEDAIDEVMRLESDRDAYMEMLSQPIAFSHGFERYRQCWNDILSTVD